jgi:hypothetical protein
MRITRSKRSLRLTSLHSTAPDWSGPIRYITPVSCGQGVGHVVLAGSGRRRTWRMENTTRPTQRTPNTRYHTPSQRNRICDCRDLVGKETELEHPDAGGGLAQVAAVEDQSRPTRITRHSTAPRNRICHGDVNSQGWGGPCFCDR